ncbi:MAG: hypothetical protein AAGB22_14450, partial [Bacteroidota bacterium]
TILQAGLSTESHGDPLETGGMFSIAAVQQGQSLAIDAERPLYVDVPTAERKQGMQLFEGELQEDGTINWTDPTALRPNLTPVNIHQLNFYPPGYEDSLAAWGHDTADKVHKDSLFYSFSCTELFQVNYGLQVAPEAHEAVGLLVQLDGPSTPDTSAATVDSISTECNGIRPSDIRTIWTDRYQNTNLATREFEARLPFLYGSCQRAALDLYVENLDRPLHEVDAMVAALPGLDNADKFREFAKLRTGRVVLDDALAQRLGAFYDQQRNVFETAVKETYRAWWDEQARLDREGARKRQEHAQADLARKYRNFQQELVVNLNEAYRQLGYPQPIWTERNSKAPIVSPAEVPRYRAAVRTTGWKNIDRYTREATANRTTLDFTDKTG